MSQLKITATGFFLLITTSVFSAESGLEEYIRQLEGVPALAGTGASTRKAALDKAVTTGGLLVATYPNPSPALEGRFSRTVALAPNGDVMTGAASMANPSGAPGTVYTINKTTGVVNATIPNPTPSAGDGFGSFVWSTPTKIIVGAPHDDDITTDSGKAYVFDASGALLHSLVKPGIAGEEDWFGWSVNALGEKALVGCRHDDTSGTETGSCYMFDSNTGAFLRKFNRQPTPVAGDNFGLSIAGVGSNRVLVGAPGADSTTTTDCGAAYVFDATTGVQIFELKNPYPVANAYMGFLVRAVGDDFLVGAPASNYAYLFSGVDGSLIQRYANPEPGDPQTNGFYAVSIASAGDNVFVGNPKSLPEAAALKGAVYVFRKSTGALRYKIESPLNQFNFGVSVYALPNHEVLVGENLSDIDTFQRAGRAYSFNVGPAAAADTGWLNME